jgi:hypothetical protein
MELVSNKHLSSIYCMKFRYVSDKYMHFMAANRGLPDADKHHPLWVSGSVDPKHRS